MQLETNDPHPPGPLPTNTTIASKKLGAGGQVALVIIYIVHFHFRCLSSAPVCGVRDSDLDMITALLQQRLADGAGVVALS